MNTRNKIPTALLGAVLASGVSNAQETPLAKQVLETKIHIQGKNKLTIHKVGRPSAADIRNKLAELEQKRRAANENPPPASTLPDQSFGVLATKYANGISLVKWWSLEKGEQTQHTALSTVDWNHLSTVHQIEGTAHQFSFMTFTSIAQPENQLPSDGFQLSQFLAEVSASNEAIFQINQSSAPDEAALEFIESMHGYYNTNDEQLARTHAKQLREAELKKQQEKNNPQLNKIEVRFWKRED